MNKISDFFGILFDISKRIVVGIFKFFPWLFKVDAGNVLIDLFVFFVFNYFVFKKFNFEFPETGLPDGIENFLYVLYVSFIGVGLVKVMYESQAKEKEGEEVVVGYRLRDITVEKYFLTRFPALILSWIFAYLLMMFFLLLLVVPRLIFHF